MNEPHINDTDDDSTTGRSNAPGLLGALSATLRRISDAVGPSVVSIGRNGRGSGFVVGPERVLTSAHNLRDRTVSVTFSDGRTEQATEHGSDADGDLVVLAVPTGDAAPLTFADTVPAIGDAVLAASRGGHRSRITLGFVSDVDRSFEGPRGRTVPGGFEHSAPLPRGSSGGPVLDGDGRVVGVDTHRAGEGFYLARPTDQALQGRIGDLAAGNSVERRRLGVALAPEGVAAKLRRSVGLAERDGLLVRAVSEDGPAARAGVIVGDLLVRAGTVELTDVAALQAALDASSIELGIVRGAAELTITVVFEDAAPAA